MRTITNKLGLPEAIINAINADDYDRGDCDFTATELISPPRIRALKKRHEHEIEVDAADLLYALEGKMLHKILEHSAGKEALIEKRFYAKVDGYTISAQIDNLTYECGTLSDWKFTSRFKFKPGKVEPDWEAQLNIQRFCMKDEHEVNKLQIIGFAKDHSKIQAFETPGYYPFRAINIVDIPVWDFKKTEAFIRHRIELHEMAKKELPRCEPGEHWQTKRCKYYCEVARFCEQELTKEQLDEIQNAPAVERKLKLSKDKTERVSRRRL